MPEVNENLRKKDSLSTPKIYKPGIMNPGS